MVLFVLQHECWITHTISATQGSTYNLYAVQHGNASSHTWNTAIQGALGLLNAAKVPGFYTGTHVAYPGGMTRLSWPGWLVKTERVRTFSYKVVGSIGPIYHGFVHELNCSYFPAMILSGFQNTMVLKDVGLPNIQFIRLRPKIRPLFAIRFRFRSRQLKNPPDNETG